MDKTALLMMLASAAPKLLALIKNHDSAKMFPNIMSALDNGYDPGLIEEELNKGYPTDEELNNEYSTNLVDFLYDNSAREITPNEWYGRTLYDPENNNKGLLNFEVQGQGNPSFGPADLTNPESENALLAFSGPGYPEVPGEWLNLEDLYKRIQNQDRIATLLHAKNVK